MKNREKRDKRCYECKMSRCHAITVMNVTQSNFAYGSSAYAVKSTSQSYTFTSINDTFYHTFARFSVFPTLASGASIARGCPPPIGGACLAPSLRSRGTKSGRSPNPLAFPLQKEKVSQKKRNIFLLERRFAWADYKQKPSAYILLPKKKRHCKSECISLSRPPCAHSFWICA